MVLGSFVQTPPQKMNAWNLRQLLVFVPTKPHVGKHRM